MIDGTEDGYRDPYRHGRSRIDPDARGFGITRDMDISHLSLYEQDVILKSRAERLRSTGDRFAHPLPGTDFESLSASAKPSPRRSIVDEDYGQAQRQENARRSAMAEDIARPKTAGSILGSVGTMAKPLRDAPTPAGTLHEVIDRVYDINGRINSTRFELEVHADRLVGGLPADPTTGLTSGSMDDAPMIVRLFHALDVLSGTVRDLEQQTKRNTTLA